MIDLPYGDNPFLADKDWRKGTKGYLYILTNDYMPRLVKVGMTTRSPKERVDELTKATGVPCAFEIDSEILVLDVYAAEKLAHYELRKYRLPGKEFFHCDPTYALARIHGCLDVAGLLGGRL